MRILEQEFLGIEVITNNIQFVSLTKSNPETRFQNNMTESNDEDDEIRQTPYRMLLDIPEIYNCLLSCDSVESTDDMILSIEVSITDAAIRHQ